MPEAGFADFLPCSARWGCYSSRVFTRTWLSWLRPENMGFSLEADSLDKAIYAFDNNLATSYKSTKALTFGVKENVKDRKSVV